MKILEALNLAYCEDKLSCRRTWGQKIDKMFEKIWAMDNEDNKRELEDMVTDAICEKEDAAFYDGFVLAMELVLACALRIGGKA